MKSPKLLGAALGAIALVAILGLSTGGFPFNPFFGNVTAQSAVLNGTAPAATEQIINGAAGGQSIIQWNTNNVVKGYIGVAGASGQLSTDSAAGDFVIRTQGGNVRVTTNSGVSSSTVATTQTGSFTATLTGMTTVVTGTINYTNAGNICTLWLPGNISGTSNANTFTVTGLPAVVTPVTSPHGVMFGDTVTDAGVTSVVGVAEVGTNAIITLGKLTGASPPVISNVGWTTSGIKGLNIDFTIVYPCN